MVKRKSCVYCLTGCEKCNFFVIPNSEATVVECFDNTLNNNNENETWLAGFEGRILLSSVYTLDIGQEINDEIINTCYQIIKENTPNLNIACLFDFEIRSMFRREPSTLWQLEHPLYNYDMIIIPAHLNGNHWIFIGASISARKITIMDSNNKTYPPVISLYNMDYANKISQVLTANAALYNLPGYENWNISEFFNVPKQYDSVDCGIFSILYAQCFVTNQDMTFTQDDMPAFRYNIKYMLVNYNNIIDKNFMHTQCNSANTRYLTYGAIRLKKYRANESIDGQYKRLSDQKTRQDELRKRENEEERSKRLSDQKIRQDELRKGENEEERSKRLYDNKFKKINYKQIKKDNLPSKYRHATDWHNVEKFCLKFNKMDIKCRHCFAKHFYEELNEENKAKKNYSFDKCCHHGKVKIDNYPSFPLLLKNLMLRKHPKSKIFFNMIRRINSSLSFASMNPIRDKFTKNRQRGPYCFRIHGQILHKINAALFPVDDENPLWGQLYLLDPSEAANIRANNNPDIEKELLNSLGNLIKSESPHAEALNMMLDEYNKEERKCKEQNIAMPNIALKFSGKNRNYDVRYNMPTNLNTVAAVFVPGADGEIPDTYVVLFPKKGSDIKIINSTDENIDPLCYPLFFPKGSLGWSIDLKQTDGKTRISRAQYCSYRLSVRDEMDTDEFNPIHYGGKLFHQYVVDQAVRIEKDRMDFIIHNQKKLLSDNYENVNASMKKKSSEYNLPVGKKIILPSSIQGTPRWQNEQYQDAMTIVSRKGGSDLFVTMTCNPDWPEIKVNLLTGQVSNDRPDLLARVFKLKRDELIKDIVKDGIFGRCIAYVNVIEFQMRGLPHMHALITLHKDDKLRYPSDIDKIILAQIPDKIEYPELYDIVARNMVHGPCGHLNPNAPCMENGKCTKHYPKNFLEETTLNEDGYPNYARPDNGRTITKGNFQLDNRWIVPYSPYLLLKYNCHINVERTFAIKSVKYLYKYIYKGPDRVELEMNEITDIEHNEVKKYIDGRAVTAPDACWKIFRFPIQEKSHAVIHLPVHLEGRQPVYWEEDWTDEQIEEAMSKKKMLQAYFDLNDPISDNYDKEAATYYYYEIPEHYTWNKTKWKKRSKAMNVLGRMYWIDPKHPEEFHLRILLTKLKGLDATSFTALRCYNDIDCGSFQNACLARGFIKNDQEWINCMEEACQSQMPNVLRILYSRILAHCRPTKPYDLWQRFKYNLIEDFLCKNNDIIAEKLAYIDFVKKLILEGETLKSFPDMPQLSDSEIVEEIDAQNELELAYDAYIVLNIDQKLIVNSILTLLNIPLPIDNVVDIGTDNTNVIFINGAGGTGKTTIYQVINHFINGYNMKVENMAFTGIAATILPNGRTLHNRFGLPVPLHSDSNSKIGPNCIAWNELCETEVFIIDEGSMIPKHAIHIIDLLMKQIIGNDMLFGGKIFLFGGDFRQILPIQHHATKSQLMSLSLKGSDLWKYFKIFNLNKNMRVHNTDYKINGLLFDEWILKIGNGELNDIDELIEIPQEIICKGLLESDVFHDIILGKDWLSLSNRAILAPFNLEVDETNEKILDMLPGEEQSYYSIDEAKNDHVDGLEANVLLTEYLHTLSPPSLPLHELKLKKHAVVMLMRNLNIKKGLCNGTRLEICGLHKYYLECKLLNGNRKGEIELIPRVTLNLEKYYPFILMRHQYPLRLAFSMTINKSQGQTFDFVGLDLKSDVFAHGQLYTAISRARGWNNLRIVVHQDNETRKVKNIVYKEIL